MDTAHQILATAEPLIALHGPEGISLREIARLAGQRNTAALQYHFGGREGLFNHWVLWRMRQVNRLRDRHFGPLPTQAGLEGLIERLTQPFLMHLKATLAQSGSSHWARCLARLDMAGTLTAPDQPADSRWQNSLLTTLSAIRQSLPAEEADFIVDLLFNSLLRGLSRIEQGISDDGWPIDSLHHHGSALQSALLGLLNTTTQPEAT